MIKRFLTSGLLALAVAAGAGDIIFEDNFNTGTVKSELKSSAGEFSVVDGALNIRSKESNPLIRVDANNWKNYQFSFNVKRPWPASPVLAYVGMRFPVMVKIRITDKVSVSAIGSDNKTETLGSVDLAGKLKDPKAFQVAVTVTGKKLALALDGETVMTLDLPADTFGGVGVGGEYQSNLLIDDWKVERMPPPSAEPKAPLADRYTRPEIKNGTFFLNGKPVFMLGVNDTSNFWEFTGNNAKPPYEPDNLWFTDLLSRQKATEVGLNCDHIYTRARQVCEPYLDEIGITPAQADLLLGNPYRDHWDGRARHRKLLSGMPLIIDYSSLWLDICFDKGVKKRLELAGIEPELHHDGGFMPYSMETRLARKIYETYFRGGAELALDGGRGNPWVYELFNEVQWYHSKHPENKRLFVQYLKQKYQNNLNLLKAAWQDDSVKSFDEIQNRMPWTGGSMRADWMMFMGDRFVQIFDDGKAAIKSVDPRPNVYFDIEISVSSLWFSQNGIDYYKLMKSADLFGTEGGMPFGDFKKGKVHWMEDVMNAKRVEVMFYHDLGRAFAVDKPVMNQESYIRRSHGEIGVVPTLRGDFPTELWFEVFHNYSGSQIYCWWKGGRDFPWKTLDDAKLSARSNPPALANPYAYPYESLKGIKDFANEIDRLAEIALPYPRTTQDIAVLYSLPSVWRQPHAVETRQQFKYQMDCFNYYDAFCRRQLPVGVVTEQELIERSGSRRVIAVPGATYVFAETVPALVKFVRDGGILIAADSSFAFDVYGKNIDAEVLKGGSKLNEFLTVKSLGKGKIYTVTSDKLDSSKLESLFLTALADGKYTIPWRVTALDGSELPDVEIQRIRRNDVDLYFLCNWHPRQGQMVRFVPAATTFDKNYLADEVVGKSYQNVYDAKQLAGGIELALPAQERVLLSVANHSRYEGNITVADEKAKLARHQAMLDAKMADHDAELTQKVALEKRLYQDARRGYDADAAKCYSLDLAKVANMGFLDEVAGDQQGGWTDQGDMDLREFPVSVKTFGGVPFKIIDPAANQGKSCVVLRGSLKFFPERTGPVAVDRKAKYLYFLHTSAWGGSKERSVEYVITLKNQKEYVFTATDGAENADWVNPKAITNGYIAWEGVKPQSFKTGVYCTRWTNPEPEVPVSNVVIRSAGTMVVPIVLAITGQE